MSDMSEQKKLSTINLTKVARKLHATTPAAKYKLERLGVRPIQEIVMPAEPGKKPRTYCLYDVRQAEKAIAEINAAKEGRLVRAEDMEEARLTPLDPAVEKLQKEVKALKSALTKNNSLMEQMLEAVTKPAKK